MTDEQMKDVITFCDNQYEVKQVRKFCISQESKLMRDEIVCLYSVVGLFNALEQSIKRANKMIKLNAPALIIENAQEQVAKCFNLIKNYKPTQKEINLLSIAYDEFENHKKELKSLYNGPVIKVGSINLSIAKIPKRMLPGRIKNLKKEIEKFNNSKMLWNLLLDHGLANECLYVKGNKLPGAGFSKQ